MIPSIHSLGDKSHLQVDPMENCGRSRTHKNFICSRSLSLELGVPMCLQRRLTPPVRNSDVVK